MKSEHLTNPLQKELFTKVVDLLLDSPRRLTWKDAEMALAEAWNSVYHRSLSQHVLVTITELEERHEILATGVSPVHAILAYCKKDDDIHSYSIDENSQIEDKDGFWYLNFRFNADSFTAKLIETRGGFVMISYTHQKESVLASGKNIHEALCHWAYDIGWHKSCLVDIYYETPYDNEKSVVTFYVEHENRIKYEATIKKEDNHILVLDVK